MRKTPAAPSPFCLGVQTPGRAEPQAEFAGREQNGETQRSWAPEQRIPLSRARSLWILHSLPWVLEDSEGQLLIWGSDLRDLKEEAELGPPPGKDFPLGRNMVFLEMHPFQEVGEALRSEVGLSVQWSEALRRGF